MPKKKPIKPTESKEQPLSHDQEAELKLGGKPEYEAYVKEHAKRMRRLRREAAGYNMEEPDYDA